MSLSGSNLGAGEKDPEFEAACEHWFSGLQLAEAGDLARSTESFAEAVKALQKLADERSHIGAIGLLSQALLTRDGSKGVDFDGVRAAAYLRKGVEKQDPICSFTLARVLLGMVDGIESKESDESEAVELLAVAAKAGHRLAQVNLGVCYSTGRGTDVDAVEAARWYKEAATDDGEDAHRPETSLAAGEKAPPGKAEACLNLGQCLCEGRGIDQD